VNDEFTLKVLPAGRSIPLHFSGRLNVTRISVSGPAVLSTHQPTNFAAILDFVSHIMTVLRKQNMRQSVQKPTALASIVFYLVISTY
jgi:hypothetical protein